MDLREGNLNDNYFICRVREFEKMYEMPWWEFFAFYQNNLESLPGYGGRASVDYSEWAFLCENFYTELTEMGDSPPCEVFAGTFCPQKPEPVSGFLFQ